MTRALVHELEQVAYRAWPAAEVEELGSWKLRSNSGVTRRANSVWPGVDGSTDSLGERIARVETFYRARRRPSIFQLCPASPPELESALLERGYFVEAPVSIQTVNVADVAPAAPRAARTGASEVSATVSESLDQDWFEVAGRRSRFSKVQEVYRGILDRIGRRAGFALARIDGRPVATALGVHEERWVGLFSFSTLPDQRRRGAARALLGALADWAERRDADRLYLQVERDNPSALALYGGAGFQEAYGYHYRVGPPADRSREPG